MPFRQIVVGDDDEENGGNLDASLSTNTGTLTRVMPSLASFAKVFLIEDVPALGPQDCGVAGVLADISDLFATDRRFNLVDGKRDTFDLRIINPRIALPKGKTVKSVHLERCTSNWILSVTANVETIKAGEESPVAKTFLVCQGVIRVDNNTVCLRDAMLPIQPQYLKVIMQEQLGQLAMEVRVEQLTSGYSDLEVSSSHKLDEVNMRIILVEQAQLGQILETRFNKEAVDKVANTEGQVENTCGGEVRPGKLADEESDANVKQTNLEYNIADPKYPNVDSVVWAQLTTVTNSEAAVGCDLEAQDKNYSRRVI